VPAAPGRSRAASRRAPSRGAASAGRSCVWSCLTLWRPAGAFGRYTSTTRRTRPRLITRGIRSRRLCGVLSASFCTRVQRAMAAAAARPRRAASRSRGRPARRSPRAVSAAGRRDRRARAQSLTRMSRPGPLAWTNRAASLSSGARPAQAQTGRPGAHVLDADDTCAKSRGMSSSRSSSLTTRSGCVWHALLPGLPRAGRGPQSIPDPGRAARR
jgi:hypothetical protein